MNLKNITSAKTAKVITSFIVTGFILASCNVKPAADFTFDKTSYNAGDVVHCKNTSTDAASYEWSYDGQTLGTKDLDITLVPGTATGIHTVKLTAFSLKGNKTSVASKNFTVN
jgi:PKD repeat protein